MTATIERPRPSTPPGPRPGSPGEPDQPPDQHRSGTPGQVLALAEAGTVALTAAAVLGMGRLFVDWSFLPELLGTALLGHAAAIALRRAGLGPAVAMAVLGVAGALVLSWLLLPETLSYGFPTGRTVDGAGTELSAAWETFTSVVAPAPVEPGFVLASAMAVWVIAVVADTALFRLGAALEGAVPAATLFLFASALGSPNHRMVLTAVLLVAVLAYMLGARALRQARAVASTGVGEPPTATGLLARALPLAAVAVVALAVVGPNIPGAGDRGIIAWRNSERSSGGARVTVSPLVDIRARLVNQSSTEVFTVRSESRAYWRLTSLDTFDGEIWSSRGSYRREQGTLPDALSSEAGVTVVAQDFTVSALASPWLPAAYRPAAVEAPAPVRYDPESGSLLAESETSDGLVYSVQSAVPELHPAELLAAPRPPSDLWERYTDLPPQFPERVVGLAREIVARTDTPYDAAIALQRHLRENFTYSLEVPDGHGSSAIEQFLFETRAGYCEQFAGTFAAMARAVGMPARVAVGFTPGEPDADGVFHVQGAHAHAWPEVYLDGFGWVAFEPTPGRGIPGAEEYTGVPEAQAPPADPTTGTTLPPTTVPAGPAASAPGDVPDLATLGGEEAGTDGADVPGGASPWPRRIAVAMAAAVTIAVAWAATVVTATHVRRRRRRTAATTAGERVQVAWAEVKEALARAGVPVRDWETNDEYAQRVAEAVELDGPVLRGLAGMATTVQFAPGHLDDDVADRATEAAAAVEDAAHRHMGWRDRLLAAVDPRPLLPTGSARVTIRRVHTPTA